MRSIKALVITLLFLLTIILATSLLVAVLASDAAAQTANDSAPADEYEETARVIRISLLHGEVSLRRAGSDDWERAKLNLPLVEGDALATASDGRAEVQIDARNFVRIGSDSVLRIVTLRDEGIALSLSEGTASVRLARFDRDKEYFEVDAPKTTLAAEKRGLYRLDVARDGNVHVSVRDGGRARIYSETSGFTLRDGRTAQLVHDGLETGDWELSAAQPFDGWDRWNDDRERYLSSSLNYEQRERYYDNAVWGAEELDKYGDWVYANDYGYIWRPRVTVINQYDNWAPYRYGRWTWVSPYGWTWVGDESWGWAPYHYGRWVYYNNYWHWAPRGYGYTQHRSWWRPALVAFVYVPTSYGEQVCWYPLTYGQRDPRARYYAYRATDRLSPLRANELLSLQRTNPAYLRAVTALPARDFGRQHVVLRAAEAVIARRAVTGEPVRGSLPIRPVNTSTNNSTNNSQTTERQARATGVPARAAMFAPVTSLPARPTGAATRKVGAPLDDELRRTRLYNGREPRTAFAPDRVNGATRLTGSPDTRSTGAIARPARTTLVRPSSERGSGVDANVNGGAPSPARPVRPARPSTSVERPASTPVYNRPDREERRTAPAPDRRTTPPRNEPPAYERPARPERTERHVRPEISSPRNEPPARREAPAQQPAPSRPAEAPKQSEPQRTRESSPAKAPERSKRDQ